jgi:hypothetical protein
MVIPYLIVAFTLGPEFPSLLGGLVGLVIVTTGARKGFLMPHKDQHWEFDESENWDPDWTGKIEISENESNTTMRLVKAWIPYLLVGEGLDTLLARGIVLDPDSIESAAVGRPGQVMDSDIAESAGDWNYLGVPAALSTGDYFCSGLVHDVLYT